MKNSFMIIFAHQIILECRIHERSTYLMKKRYSLFGGVYFIPNYKGVLIVHHVEDVQKNNSNDQQNVKK